MTLKTDAQPGRGTPPRVRCAAALAALALLAFSPTALARAAHLDFSFGDDGRVILPPDFNGEPIAATAVLARDDSLILSTGRSLRRLAPDGQLDASFGDAATLTPPAPPDGDFTIDGLAVDSQGRLIVAGTSEVPTDTAPFATLILPEKYPPRAQAARVMRYLPDGSLDPSFGDHGIVETDFGLPAPRNEAGEQLLERPWVEVSGLALDSQDRVILTGGASAGIEFACSHDWSFNTLTYAAFAARLRPDGTVDTGFGGGDGVFGGRSVKENSLHAEVSASPQVVPGDEVTYARGHGHCPRTEGSSGLARLGADGMPSRSFGAGGTVRRWSTATAVGPEGSITTLSYVSPWYFLKEPMRVVVSRLRADGKLDRSYGRRKGHTVVRSPGGPGGSLGSPVIDAHGRVLLGGTMITARTFPGPPGSTRRRHRRSLVLVRLGADGQLDRDFGRHGRLAVAFGSLAVTETSLLLDSQGRAVNVGTYGRSDKAQGIVLTRYVLDR